MSVEHRPRQPTHRPPPTSDFASDNATAGDASRDSARDYINRLRGGDMGSLPAHPRPRRPVHGLRLANDQFLTTYNLTNLVIQSGSICVLAMGLVFVLLLGEIDLSAGVAGGASATITALDASSTTTGPGGRPCSPASRSAR